MKEECQAFAVLWSFGELDGGRRKYALHVADENIG